MSCGDDPSWSSPASHLLCHLSVLPLASLTSGQDVRPDPWFPPLCEPARGPRGGASDSGLSYLSYEFGL